MRRNVFSIPTISNMSPGEQRRKPGGRCIATVCRGALRLDGFRLSRRAFAACLAVCQFALGHSRSCGFAKDSFFLHKAFFTRQPFVHLLPHWNWAGRESQIIRVMAYTNCESAELFLNGESLGMQNVDPIDMAGWECSLQAPSCGSSATTTVLPSPRQSLKPPKKPLRPRPGNPSVDEQRASARRRRVALPITAFALDGAGRRSADEPSRTVSNLRPCENSGRQQRRSILP